MLIRFRAEQQWAMDHGVPHNHSLMVRMHVTAFVVVVVVVLDVDLVLLSQLQQIQQSCRFVLDLIMVSVCDDEVS